MQQLRDKIDYSLSRLRGRSYPDKVAVASANKRTVEFVKTTDCRQIAEVGAYLGHTSLELAKFLDGRGELHVYDYEDRVAAIESNLAAAGHSNVKVFGCTYRYLDSYNWQLGKMLESSDGPVYDYVFLDGAHTWAVDALAAFLIDRLLVVGGYIDFDDYHWTLAGSPTLNPKRFPFTAKLYSDEQIAAKQVKMVVDLVIKRSGRYEEVVKNKIYRKLRDEGAL